MELAFEIGLVFGTLLGVVLGLAGSYALSRNIKISPGETSRDASTVALSSDLYKWHFWQTTLDWTELVA